MSKCRIHNVRFYNPYPYAIRAMSLQKTLNKLAVCRENADIELWNVKGAWYIERVISCTNQNSTIQAIAWCKEQLFSVGLHGFLVQHNMHKLAIENRWAVTGGACYCMDVNKNQDTIAIGTEQGYINIFVVQQDGTYFEKLFDKQEGMIICLKFDSTGDYVVSGSADAVRIWNTKTGNAIHKMTTGRSEANKPTIVWCLEVTNDFTIITGDSRGKITFWDGKVGAQNESYQSHKADVLTLCLSEDHNKLYCAGVDPNIITYEKIHVRGENEKWVKSIQRKIHEHDVNALVLYNDKLCSGGADSYLACSYHPPKTLLKFPPIPQHCTHLAKEARFTMFRHSNFIELWSLGDSQEVDKDYTGLIRLQSEPKKLLVLQRSAKNEDGESEHEGIICCSISNDGRWILYSTQLGTRVFRLDKEGENLTMNKIYFEHCDIPCVQAIFYPDSTKVITCPNSGGLFIYEITAHNELSLKQIIESNEIQDTVTFIHISPCGKYLMAGDPCSNIVIWKFTTVWVYHCKIPKYRFPPTAMAIHPKQLNAVIVYSDHKIVEYNIEQRKYTAFSEKFETCSFKSLYIPIKAITFDPRAENVILLHDDSYIYVISKEKNIVGRKSKKAKRSTPDLKPANGFDEQPEKVHMNTVKKYKHLAHLQWLDNDEVVAVEVNPLALIEKLPPAFAQATFGMK